MRNILYRLCLTAILVITGFLLVPPLTARADGGPVLSNPELWAQLKEGQQTAVVTLRNDGTADVDLFVSLLDSSGQSHEVVFFVPLGMEPADFQVVEETSLAFDRQMTEELDEAIRDGERSKKDIRLSLLSAALAINGGWTSVVWFPLLLSGCAAETAPVATYETESSRVDIYGLDDDTDLEALISTTGLDSSVKATLSRLRGQRIAIVTLQTQPPPAGDGNSWHPGGQPGIHLAWTTALITQSATTEYAYPLGTGSAWAHPIELTRVYVVAPPGLDFTVRYPELGADYSGYTRPIFGRPEPKVIRHYQTTAYAVDEVWSSHGHIWRATYTQSNSAEDVVIVVGASGGFLSGLRRVFVGWGTVPNMLIGLLLALAVWVTTWRYIIPRMLGAEYKWRNFSFWRDALIYPGINIVLLAGGTGIFAVLLLAAEGSWPSTLLPGLLLVVLIGLPVVFALPGLVYLLKWHWEKFNTDKYRSVTAYFVVILIANFVYLALAAAYSALIGVL